MNPWDLELILVRDGSHGGGDRRALTRNVERGLLIRVRQGAYVEREAWSQMDTEARHVVAMRALTMTSNRPPVFSHWSAAVVHRLPFVGQHLGRLHVTVADQEQRSGTGVAGHVFALRPQEVLRIGGLLVTDVARTVVDVAGAGRFDEGVVIADGALRVGVPRAVLEAAVDLAGPRRSATRIGQVVAFAHPGAESAAESETRVTFFVAGVEPPELQHEVSDEHGLIGRTDNWWQRVRGIGEVDGAKKYLDPRLATAGAGQAVYREKLREDRLRAQADGLARWGWRESRSIALLLPVIARIGVRPLARKPTLEDWAVLARAARPSAFIPERGGLWR